MKGRMKVREEVIFFKFKKQIYFVFQIIELKKYQQNLFCINLSRRFFLLLQKKRRKRLEM